MKKMGGGESGSDNECDHEKGHVHEEPCKGMT